MTSTKDQELAVMDPGTRDVSVRVPAGFTAQPSNLAEAMEFAKLIAHSTMIPTHFQGKPGDIVVVMMQAQELNIPYFQALHNTAVINGRPTIWGDLVTAIVQRSGKLEYMTKTWEESTLTATCRIKRVGKPEHVETFSLADATRAGLAGKDTYKKFPQRMHMWKAVTWACRSEFPDVLKGMDIAEEAMDFPPVAAVEPLKQIRPTAELVDGFIAPPPKEKGGGKGPAKPPLAKGEPGDEGGPEVVRVLLAELEKEGNTKGKTWTLYGITLEDGRKLATFSSTIFETAVHAKDFDVPVRIATKVDSARRVCITSMEAVMEDAPDEEAAPDEGGKDETE